MTISNKYERLASSLARATMVCGVGCYALGFGALFVAFLSDGLFRGVDVWSLFGGVAVFTAAGAAIAVLAGMGSLLMRHLSKAGGVGWKRTLWFSILAAAYIPLMSAILMKGLFG